MPRCELPVADCADPVLPDQFAGLRVQCLHDVSGIVDEHNAVVHQRRGLIRAFVHRPHPLELQAFYVLRGDLVQGAVIVGVIVVANHQPVVGIGITQHRVGDGRIVLDFSGDGQASGSSRNGRFGSSTKRLTGAPPRPPRPARPGAACASAPTRRDRADADTGRSRHRQRAWSSAIRFENERSDVEICRFTQAAGISRWHRSLHETYEVAGGASAPAAHEQAARQLRRIVAASRSAPWHPAQFA